MYVPVNFISVNIYFPVFLGMAMYAKEFKTKKIQKLTEIKT